MTAHEIETELRDLQDRFVDLMEKFTDERRRIDALAEGTRSRPSKPDAESKLRQLLDDINDDSCGICFGPDDRQAAILELFGDVTELGLAEIWVVGELASGLRASREELGPLLRVKEPINR